MRLIILYCILMEYEILCFMINVDEIGLFFVGENVVIIV